MDTADGLPFFDLLRNGDHILLPFCNGNTILLRKTSSRENLRPPGSPFLVSYYSIIKFLMEENQNCFIQQKARKSIVPAANRAGSYFAIPYPKNTLLCWVLSREKMGPPLLVWNNGCEDYPGHS